MATAPHSPFSLNSVNDTAKLIYLPHEKANFYTDIPGLFIAKKVKVKSLSRVQLCNRWTVAYQAPPSMGFSRQEYWSGLPFPSPGDLRHPEIELRSRALQADALPSEPPRKPLTL